jgi:hypothetical protein
LLDIQFRCSDGFEARMKRWTDCLLSKGHQLRGKTKKTARSNAIRTSCGTHSHMSAAEAQCCGMFQLLEKAGELTILESQPNVFLTEARIRVIPDWLIEYKDGRKVYADYKGFETQSWRRNRKLWMHYAKLPMEVWKKKGERFFISETINTKEPQ